MLLQVRLELTTPALLNFNTQVTDYKYRALTNCATGALRGGLANVRLEPQQADESSSTYSNVSKKKKKAKPKTMHEQQVPLTRTKHVNQHIHIHAHLNGADD